jgi:hypothetical protein
MCPFSWRRVAATHQAVVTCTHIARAHPFAPSISAGRNRFHNLHYCGSAHARTRALVTARTNLYLFSDRPRARDAHHEAALSSGALEKKGGAYTAHSRDVRRRRPERCPGEMRADSGVTAPRIYVRQEAVSARSPRHAVVSCPQPSRQVRPTDRMDRRAAAGTRRSLSRPA